VSAGAAALAPAVSRAYTMGSNIITFYAQSVGRPMNLSRELSLLLEWEEACLAGIRAAREEGRSIDMRMLAQQLAECRVYLAINAEEKPR
jgi:hypothetical protein